jgi:signal peptidase I
MAEERGMTAKHMWRGLSLKFWREWCRPILIVVLVMTSLRSAVADWNDVPTGSMKPTILEGDRIFVNKLAYDLKVPFTRRHIATWGNPARGEVVVLFSPANEMRLVKRVIGLPGDLLELRDNRLFVNNEPADYEPLSDEIAEKIHETIPGPYALGQESIDGMSHPVMLMPTRPSLRWFGPVVVPEGHYFVMGDNRDESADSRWFGFVARDRIVGRATRVVLSVDPEHRYYPRWSRFFRSVN